MGMVRLEVGGTQMMTRRRGTESEPSLPLEGGTGTGGGAGSGWTTRKLAGGKTGSKDARKTVPRKGTEGGRTASTGAEAPATRGWVSTPKSRWMDERDREGGRGGYVNEADDDDDENEEEEEPSSGFPSPPSVLTQIYHRHRTALSRASKPSSRGARDEEPYQRAGNGRYDEGGGEGETPRTWIWGGDGRDDDEGERMVNKARGIAERLERLDPGGMGGAGTGLAREAAAVAALRKREGEVEESLARDLEERVQGLVEEHAERVALCEDTERELVQGMERIKEMLGKLREERRALDDAYETCLGEVQVEFRDALREAKQALLDEERYGRTPW